MDDEIVFGLVSLVLSYPVAAVWERWSSTAPTAPSARHLEARLWWRLWAPLLPPAFAIAALVGWAIVEPADDVVSPSSLGMAALPFALIWTRAGLRALRAARRPRGGLAYTFGLLRPRVVLAQELVELLDPAALRAAEAHEMAHARRWDPLRILVARIAADLQWPLPGAARRLRAWLDSLELARDEEARLSGVEGADLAAAILATAQLGTAPSPSPACLCTPDAGPALKHRIERLLSPLHPPPESSAWWPVLTRLLWPALLAAAVVGATFGGPVMGLVSMAP